MSNAELELLLDDLESDKTERKEAWAGSAPEKSRQAVCAFANDLPDHQAPGYLFIGAKDDGTPSNLAITDELLQTLGDIRSDGKIVPLPRLTVEKRHLKGADMAVVTVWPAIAPPVRYEGRIWIRVGPRRAVASAQEERVLNEKRKFRDQPFDLSPVSSCPFEELSQAEFESSYLASAFAPDVLAANERSFAQRLAALRMISSLEEKVPTVLGVLTIGKSPRTWLPGAYVQFLRIAGISLDDPIADAADIDGAFATMLRGVDEKLRAHITQVVDIVVGDREKRKIDYPLSALQQLVRNAVMHRVYEGTNAPIRVYWFNDRIEILSPGGPFGIVNAENFGKPHIADYRNPHIAEAMKVLGYVQRFGVGIATARRELERNGNPPLRFDVQQNAVLATIRKAQ